MGDDTLVTRANGQVIDQDDPNIFNRVLEGDFVGRDSSGAPTPGQNLGTFTVPWGTARITTLILDGLPVDPGLITAPPNRVVSGAIRSTSDFPDYLRPAGSSASFTVLGLATTLELDVNGIVAEITTDIVKGSLTVAPVANNTCLINDVGLTGQDTTRFLGENGTGITVDGMGSELSGKVGEFVALLNQTTNEIIYCRIVSTTRLDHARRGFCFDSSGNPVAAGVLLNNDVLQILSLGFIFADKDAVSIDVTYSNPAIGGDQPLSPQTGDYWYDLAANVWKRYSGSSFVEIDRTYIGMAVIDTANCIGTRPEYFSKSFADNNTLKVSLKNIDVVVADVADFLVSINGKDKRFDFSFFQWAAATDFESGFTRVQDRNYWLYITEDGKPIISGYKPYDVRGFLRGWYHPYESWRAVAQIFNNSSHEFGVIHSSDATLNSLIPIPRERVTIANSSGVPVTNIEFSGGLMVFDDNTGEAVAPVYEKSIGANWAAGNLAGMLDTGTVALSTWYDVYVIHNSKLKLTDYISTINPSTSPALPTGYDKQEYRGAIYYESTSNIALFFQYKDFFQWETLKPDIAITSGTLLIGPTLRALSVPGGSPMRAKIIIDSGKSSGANYGLIDNPAQAAQTPGLYKQNLVVQSGGNQKFSVLDIITNSSSQIRETFNAAVGLGAGQYHIHTDGWNDLRLKI